MKRFFQILILILICILSSTVGIAATKEDVIAAISASYDVAGTTFRLPDEIIAKGTDFLNKYNMTSEQYSQIMIQINEAVATTKQIGTLDVNKMTDEQKASLIIILLEVIKIANLNMELIESKIDVDSVMQEVNNSIQDNVDNSNTNNINNTKPNIPKTDIDNQAKDEYNKIQQNTEDIFFKKTGNVLSDKQIFVVMCLIAIFILVVLIMIRKHIKVDNIKDILHIGLVVYIFVLAILIPVSYIYIDNKSIIDFVTYVGTNNIYNNDDKNDNDDKNKNEVPKITYNEIYGKLIIDNLNINLDIYYGDSDSILQKGVGHYPYSYLPGEGKAIIYTTHNTKDKLYNLKDIRINDVIKVSTTYGEYKYKVYSTEVVLETQKEKVENTIGKEVLMIYTCYPFNDNGYTNKRFIVYSELMEEKK